MVLEPAVAASIGASESFGDHDGVDDETPVATTVHDRQVIDEPIDVGDHDVPIDLVVTPSGVHRPETGAKPAGIDWDRLDDERLEEIPVLRSL